MEANNKPASSIHLGSGESWAPIYFSKDQVEANKRINRDAKNYQGQDLTDSVARCNLRWSELCYEILNSGASAIQRNMLEPDHIESFEALGNYLTKIKDDPQSAANLILDSATVHQKIVVRVVRTLKPPGK
jgi:hypothetical protein